MADSKRSRSSSKRLVSGKRQQIIPDNFIYTFREYCSANDCQTSPAVYAPDEQGAENLPRDFPTILVYYREFGSLPAMEKLLYKSFPIELKAFWALQKTIEREKTISILQLEHCYLTSEHIEILQEFLINSVSIKEVSVNGNPNTAQNHYLLLKGTNLTQLSLKLCSIDVNGIKNIAEELKTAYDGTLKHLNLSGNLLFDEGMTYIAGFLRVNRTLLSLNLADNKIYDTGCLQLLQPFQKFSLQLDEIVLRRQIKFDFAKKIQQTEIESDIIVTKSNKNSFYERYSTKSNKSNKSLLSHDDEYSKKSRNTFDLLKMQKHPFVQDSFEEDDEIFCIGNDSLFNLNLSYNKITKRGLRGIVRMLHYQRFVFVDNKGIYDGRGISRISVDGNDINVNCEDELNEIDIVIIGDPRKDSAISQMSVKKVKSRLRYESSNL